MKDPKCMQSLRKETHMITCVYLVLTCVEYNVQENNVDGDSHKPSCNQI